MAKRKSNSDAVRLNLYGICGEDFRALIKAQEGRCAACGKGETAIGRTGKVRTLSIDHCHKTGRVRGLLCHKCNIALGCVDDNPQALRRLAAYLEVADAGRTVKDLVMANRPTRAAQQRYAYRQVPIDANQILADMLAETKGE